jgi:hypothetical protein
MEFTVHALADAQCGLLYALVEHLGFGVENIQISVQVVLQLDVEIHRGASIDRIKDCAERLGRGGAFEALDGREIVDGRPGRVFSRSFDPFAELSEREALVLSKSSER